MAPLVVLVVQVVADETLALAVLELADKVLMEAQVAHQVAVAEVQAQLVEMALVAQTSLVGQAVLVRHQALLALP